MEQTKPPSWVRVTLVILAVPNLIAGLWAVIAPEHWFDNFPGWAPRLVAAIPPFNEHLATDAGSGLLAVGVVAAWAYAAPRRDVLLTAMAGAFAFSAPHALYHLFNPSDGLTAAEDVLSTGSLLVSAGLAIAVLAYAWRMDP